MSNEAKLFNFLEKRQELVDKKRRKFERVMFDNFLGCFSVIDNNGTMFEISLNDISQDGMQFQIPWTGKQKDKGKFQVGQELNIRFYFTQTSYIPASVTIRYESEGIDGKNGAKCLRYGAKIDSSTSSYQALQSFIQFIYQFAKHSVEDKGDRKVYFL